LRIPIRLRLTIVFTLSMAALLAITGSLVYLRLGAELLRSTDTALLSEASAAAAGLGQQGSAFNAPVRGLSPGTFTQVLGPTGLVLESSAGVNGRSAVPRSALGHIRGPAFFDRAVGGAAAMARIVVVPETDGRQRVFVVAGTPLRGRADVLSALLVLLLAGGTVTLALAAALGWAVAGAALRPVERMRQEADAISVSDRGRRLPVPGTRDEIERLGTTLNAMLGRMEAAFDAERRFVDDASHEFRTPVAILKAELDLAQARPRTNRELLAAVRSASEEADRLNSLAETLLIYSRTEGGRMPLHCEPTDLDQLLREACSSLTARAEAEGVGVRVNPHAVTARVDPVRIRQAVENLVSNALAHTPRGGQVRAGATLESGIVRLTVLDTGAGFDPDFLPRAFEAFATDPALAEGPGRGAGLGLAIVQAIVHAHGGHASAENRPEGGGCVTLLLPVAR
jgi:two-component system, OmpR family, sensor kinase